MDAIQIQSFSKSYATTAAVRDVSLSVAPGELFGLIGPDGAGKTTTMRAVCTLLVPDRGTILLQGLDVTRDVGRIRAILGYMPQRFSLYQDLSVEQNLRFFAELFQVTEEERVAREEQLYRFSRLDEFKKRKAAALSGGMKQKLALMCALVHTPEVLVLDEPTTGVDPVSRQEFWEILHSIQKQGTTILVSTAYLDEADKCDRVALMHCGRIASMGTPSDIRDSFRHPLYRLKGKDARALRAYFDGLREVMTTQLFGDAVHAVFRAEPEDAQWRAWVTESRGNLEHWNRQVPSIEDVFLERMTGAVETGETV